MTLSGAIINRVELRYRDLSADFCEKDGDFTKQYHCTYNARLKIMRELLLPRIHEKWGNSIPVKKLCELQDIDEKYIVVGTIFKNQILKPSILKQIAEANSLLPQLIHHHLTSDSDQLFLEDEAQRCSISGNVLETDHLVTGITCALLGTNLGKGKFLAEDVCWADCREQIERPVLLEDHYILFISSLDLANDRSGLKNLEFFIEWVSGLLSSETEKISRISRIVVAGNSIRSQNVDKSLRSLISKQSESADTIEAVNLLDEILFQLAQTVDVDLMPGECDPSNHVLPQQPMHKCIFNQANRLKSFHRVTNPYQFEVGGVKILGSSGQPVADILKFSNIEEPVEALEKCLLWNHLAPTAPDTLGCFPFYDSDPFVIKECPHVFFATNQPNYQTKIFTGPNKQLVRLICVPEFCKDRSVILLNLRSLECERISFNFIS